MNLLNKKTWIIFILLLLLLLTSCKEEELTEIKIGLSWIHESQFAGYYWADSYGYYLEKGLNVTFYPYNFTILEDDLIEGKFDFVLLQTDSFLKARERGLPLKALFVDYKLIPTVYFSKKSSNITSPKDLIGRRVGVAYSERYPLIAMLDNKGIDPQRVMIVERDYDYSQLKNDELDVQAGWITDGDTVEKELGEYNAIYPYEYSVNFYSDILCAKESYINTSPDMIQAFIDATKKGWERSIENPEEAALLTMNYEDNLDEEHLIFVLEKSIPLIHTGEEEIGWIDFRVLNNSYSILREKGYIENNIDINESFTNRFIRSK